jgi:DNA (cytosine-5)-methyltransferase 1
MQKKILLGSLFDGIGAFPLGASFFGIKTLWASEILPAAISVTGRHFPEMKHMGDITKLDGGLLPPVDVVCFGSPCTDVSLAGRRAGLDGKQSSLFYEAIRIIREMRCATNGKYPRYAIFENVPGLFSSNSGRDYKTVLEAFTESEIPMPGSGRWANAGMVRSRGIDLAWCVYDAQHFGLAQRRRRVFLVADFGGASAGKILFVPKSLRGDTPQSGETGEGSPPAAARSVDGTDTKCLNALGPQRERTFWKSDLSSTLADADEGVGRRPAGLSWTQKAYGMCSVGSNSMKSSNPSSGFYEADTCRTLDANGGNPCCNQGGIIVMARSDGDSCAGRKQNIVCMETAPQNAEICDALCPAITGAAGTSGNNRPYDAYGFDLHQITRKTNRSVLTKVQPSLCAAGNSHVVHPQIAGTLCSSAAGLSRTAGMASETDLCVVEANRRGCGAIPPFDTVTYCLQGNMIGRDDRNGPAGGGVNEEISYTLNGTDRHAVAKSFGNNSIGGWNDSDAALKASGGENGDGSENLELDTDFIVRRLTPTECERLMGFHDGWTAFGCNGEPISDSKRYQMLGNSIAVPCIEYIMQGIIEESEWR